MVAPAPPANKIQQDVSILLAGDVRRTFTTSHPFIYTNLGNSSTSFIPYLSTYQKLPLVEPGNHHQGAYQHDLLGKAEF